MDRKYEISKPQLISSSLQQTSPASVPPPPPPPPSSSLPVDLAPDDYQAVELIPWDSTIPRPLSDIRELSEPSLMDHVTRFPHPHRRSASRGCSRLVNLAKREDARNVNVQQSLDAPCLQAQPDGSSSYSSTPEQPSFYSIPQSSVPQRSSSFHRQPRLHSRKTSMCTQPPSNMVSSNKVGFSIPNRGTSQSPVKQAGLKGDPIISDCARRIPSRTHIRTPHPIDILDFPLFKHPRIKLELQVSAPLFVGGGSVEGHVKVTVDDNERVKSRRSLSIGALSVDLIGIEQMDGGRRASFLALGTELIDVNHPPPPKMVLPPEPLFADDKFWSLAPSCSTLPFMISLPLDTGPPPFHSKHASIRFILSATALVRDAGKHYRARVSSDVQVLPTYDPEKALTSLASPLTSFDELSLPRSISQETLRVTAGLHRQVWVSGSSIFVDIHISNKCHKPVKRLELTLERDVLCYKHAAAATMEKSASQARIFESNEQTILGRTSFKPGTGAWHGVEPYTSEIRTCELEIPRGHGTVRCGKYFEVRYFLNAMASLSNSKAVSVQLPIILIHMNSLDVVPNSIAQVAAAIEEKRAGRQASGSLSGKKGPSGHYRQRSFSSPVGATDLRRQPSYSQGRAFAAPRQQSMDRERERRADMDSIRDILDSSPRKNAPPSVQRFHMKKIGSGSTLRTRAVVNGSMETNASLGANPYEKPPAMRGLGSPREGQRTRERIRRVGSLDSIRSKRSDIKNAKDKGVNDQNARPRLGYAAIGQVRITPHTLGLTTATGKVSMDSPPAERSGSVMSIREKLDRSRFEFKGVSRKASSGFKERSLNWWESKRNRDDEKKWAGWI